MSETLVVNEIYLSLQGESTYAGLPCIFVRLTACNLRCSYCDTAYAFTEGKKMEMEKILERIEELAKPFADQGNEEPRPNSRGRSGGIPAAKGAGMPSPRPSQGHLQPRLPLVEFTGGEPLLQKQSASLMQKLCDAGYEVLLETSGAHDISIVDVRVHRIMDLKCPSSGESARNLWSNLEQLTLRDEIKFVIGTHEDYVWARDIVRQHRLDQKCPILFSWVAPLAAHQRDKSLKAVPKDHHPITRLQLVEQIIQDHLPVRFQLQMHKIVWDPDLRGV